MSADDKFLQFPLCALSLAPDPHDVLNHILSYGMIEAGVGEMNDLDDDERIDKCNELNISTTLFNSFELAAHLGAKVCGMTVGGVDGSTRRHSALKAHHSKWEVWNGKDALVRMKRDICFEVRDGGQMSWREFRVLAGINSVIGSKPYPVMIRLSTIGVRSRGCLSLDIEKKASCAKKRGGFVLPAALTPKQLRLTVDRLHELGWFARVTPDPHGRATYYSNRMTRDEMREKLFKKRTYAPAFHAEQRSKNADLADRIKKAKGTFNNKTEKGTFNNGAEAHPTEGTAGAPLGQYDGTATAPGGQQEGHREGTFNRNPLNRNSGNRNPSNTNSQNRNSLNDGAGALAIEEEEDFSKPVPTSQNWERYLRAFHPDLVGLATWEASQSEHRKFQEWISF